MSNREPPQKCKSISSSALGRVDIVNVKKMWYLHRFVFGPTLKLTKTYVALMEQDYIPNTEADLASSRLLLHVDCE